jgi:exodeoxyribonuclease III
MLVLWAMLWEVVCANLPALTCFREKPLKTITSVEGLDEAEAEGRVVAAEMKDFWLVNVYVPNSGRAEKGQEANGPPRLGYRTETWAAFCKVQLPLL